jgi:hypothetical protein
MGAAGELPATGAVAILKNAHIACYFVVHFSAETTAVGHIRRHIQHSLI